MPALLAWNNRIEGSPPGRLDGQETTQRGLGDTFSVASTRSIDGKRRGIFWSFNRMVLLMEAPVIDLGRLAQDLQLRKVQVAAVVELLDSGNTVPFITRYRKEVTGGLDEEQIRAIQHRVGQLRQLAERRQTILRTLEAQGTITDELRTAIERADTSKRLEDLYLPFKPKKQTLATIAREKGLGPLADAIWTRDEAVRNLAEILPGVVNPDKQLATEEEILTGLQHILAEKISEDAEVRQIARGILWNGILQTVRAANAEMVESNEPGPQPGLDEFRNYFRYEEPIRHVPPHRILAINRGERRGVLKVKLDFDREHILFGIKERLELETHPHRDLMEKCVADAIDRLLVRSLDREVRGEITEWAEGHAVDVFARNLRNLLLQPPVHGKRILAIDPGYKTGCKWTILDEIGNLIDQGTIFPHLKRKKKPKKKGAGVAVAEAPDGEEGSDEEEAEESPVHQVDRIEQASEIASAGSEGDPGEDPPVLSADSVHRSTDGESAEDHGLEAEITKDWQEITQGGFVGGANAPIHPKHRGDQPKKPPRRRPAWFGIVIPPPGIFDEPKPKPAKSPMAEEANISRRDRSKKLLAELCNQHRIDVLAIGNGTACRETEELIAEMIAEGMINVPYVIVNEAGASVYSTSTVGREEFPEFDATLRGTISIGRRLQDPLSELVKIDPQNIGVGLYQHDINPRMLKESLSEVVESCVNYVGVDLNTASVPLLRYVSGLNQLRAKNLADYRKQHGRFTARDQIKEVSGIGPETFTQAAGFLKIVGGDNLLDSTWIHPESYAVAQKMLELLGLTLDDQGRVDPQVLAAKLEEIPIPLLAERAGAGEPTVRDILDNLVRPGRDPREDLPKPIFKTGILRIEDLQSGMELKGTVLNVVDFGVFVDIGLKDSGLVHISEVADRFIRSPHDVVSVGDVVTIWVLNVDMQRRRVSLSMMDPERPRVPRGPRGRRGGRPGREGEHEHESSSHQGGATGEQERPPRQDRRDQPPQERRQPQGGQGGQGRPGQPRQGQQGQRDGGGGQYHQRQGQHDQRRGQGRGQDRQRGQQRADQGPRIISAAPKEKKPPIKLTDEKIAGQQDLHSFGELKALFEHHKKGPETPKTPKKPTDGEQKSEGS
ncbi:RNA-binding transcriptional accessory protein [bacterium]|nr:RNA-binding transcriptional accessory protein [bacterium]